MTVRPPSRTLVPGKGGAVTAVMDAPVAPSGWWAGLVRWHRGRCTQGLLKILIQAGDWNDPSDDERTVRTIGRWLQRGADPNACWRRTWGTDGWDETPALLLLLGRSWSLDAVWNAEPGDAPDGQALVALRGLLDAGADPNRPQVYHEATPEPQEVVEIAPGHQMVRGSTRNGMSMTMDRRIPWSLPLHQALAGDLDGAVALLLDAGACATEVDNGKTVWDLVRDVPTAQRLLDHGGDPFQPNADGLTRTMVEMAKDPEDRNAELLAWLERRVLQQTLLEADGTVSAPAPRGRPRL